MQMMRNLFGLLGYFGIYVGLSQFQQVRVRTEVAQYFLAFQIFEFSPVCFGQFLVWSTFVVCFHSNFDYFVDLSEV